MKAARFSLQLLIRERDLADRRMHVAGLVDPELDLTRLDLLHRTTDVERDGTGLSA